MSDMLYSVGRCWLKPTWIIFNRSNCERWTAPPSNADITGAVMSEPAAQQAYVPKPFPGNRHSRSSSTRFCGRAMCIRIEWCRDRDELVHAHWKENTMSSDSDRRTFSGPEVRVDTQNIKTGVDALKAKVWSVWRRGNFGALARDVQYPIGDLEGWVTGQKPRPPDVVMSAGRDLVLQSPLQS